MHLDKYKQSDGWYKDEHGTSFENIEQFLSSIFGFCGCGAPWAALKKVAETMRAIQDCMDGKITWEQRNALIPDEGLRYIVWYMLDDRRMIEHGSSVPGWLTEQGKLILEDLEEYLKLKEKENE